jgi:hypothetical protein
MALTREEILNRKVGRRTVTLPGGGEVVIRGLSHGEVSAGQEQHEVDVNARTCFYIATALVDPVLSFDDVLTWSQDGNAGDLTTISEAIQELSALTEGAGKSRNPSARRRR